MNIEELVEKYERLIPAGAYTLGEGIRAALTEMAAGYEQQLAFADDAAGKGALARSLADGMAMEIAELKERIRQLEARLGGYLTVGGGHIVHGTAEALARVQAYILLDSKHPVEARDTNRYFAKQLQAAEQRIRQLEAERLPECGDMVLVPRGILAAASYAIAHQKKADKVLEQLRSYSIAAPQPKKEGE